MMHVGWKLILGAVALAILAPLSPGAAGARNSGIDSGAMQLGPATCNGVGCHANSTTDVTVTLTGPIEITEGESEMYTVSISENVQGALLFGAGLSVKELDAAPPRERAGC